AISSRKTGKLRVKLEDRYRRQARHYLVTREPAVKRLSPGYFFACIIVLSLAGFARAENWPQWRGPDNDGVCHEKNLPSEWSANKNLLWKLKMPGVGGSTPAIWGDRIFLTSGDGDKVVLLCVSTKGKELWRKELGPNSVLKMRDEGNGASASPCTD